MGEMVMTGYGLDKPVRGSVNLDTPCGALLRELEQIWTEIGEREQDKDRMFLELETECMRVYRRKVDSANAERAQLCQSLMAKEAELKALVASIGENTPRFKVDEKHTSLKDQLAAVTPLLEDLRAKKEERMKQISNVQSQIEKIKAQISDHSYQNNDDSVKHLNDDHDLSTRRLSDLQMQLRNLQKEKSDRLQKVFIYVDEVHCLCAVLGLDFAKTVKEVHPSLHGTNLENSTNISDSTLEGLTQTILKLKAEKKTRVLKLQEIVGKLHKLWNLMESTEQERKHFAKVAAVLGSTEEEITSPGILSLETIQETEEEVERLTIQKASRMKELVLKKRLELEDICRNAHMEPDVSTAPEKIIALIDSGLVDPCELLFSIEAQIAKANEESLTRKDIMERVDKWLSACDEETWLEEYNQDDNRYSAGRGAHLNLKRAEKARILVQKIPTMIDNLIAKTFAWEDERNVPFLYDGVRLVAILEEQKLRRAQREENKRRSRDQKKLQTLLLKEKELIFGSKPSPKKTSSFNRRTSSHHPNGNGTGFMTPVPRRVSAGSATPELLTPRSYSGRYNNYFKESGKLTAVPLNFSTVSKEDSMSSFASISGSEPDSPLFLH
ncbi:65-kDa microtubule-associated protein 6-like [Phragmites australis]|uniref:65-kDa microtubule-associated protein 6-like n=1 Tax=Phragmites australis TaxID=29695 RepID=UPI002D76592E|nr:65-kDa microtubule-associated protein 6-like [Phragmites australis]